MPSLKNLSGMIKSAQCNYYESLFCEAAHAVVATSDIDASRLAKMAPDATVHVIPNSVDCEDFAPVRAATGGTTLFFSGTLSYAPNVDGLNWFVAEVLPRLRGHFGKDLPPIVVAGADPSPELAQRLAFAGIELHANPPSMLPLLAGAAVVFVPLHSGSGTRLKILEAMAAGRAVVSTGKGAEGLTLSPGFDILIADDPDRFTSAIVKLFENTKLRTELGGRASQTIENRYDWRRGRPMLEHLLTRLSSVETSKESKWRQKSSH
jgi:glycosyltransferase involved in cell wall biosynthesis